MRRFIKDNRNEILLVLFLLGLLAIGPSCGPRPATTVQPTAFTGAARATDDIASGIKLLIAAESNIEQQKMITPQEGLKIIDGLGALNAANVQFTSDLTAAKATGSKTALKPSLNALRTAVSNLNANGLLGVKSERAKQVFGTAMGAVTLALATLEAFVQ